MLIVVLYYGIVCNFLLIAELQLNPNPESFRTIFQVNFDARGLKYHMSDHGITVIIPENAVTTETILSIGVYYVNSFQLPKGHRLVSEVFWIKTSAPLQRNAELYVPHFVNVRDEKDSNKLGFFMASDVSSDAVQTLTEVPAKNCSFEPESNYGKLVMEHFCSGCILEKIDGSGLPLRYFVTKAFPNNSDESERWTADLVFSYALTFCRKVCVLKYILYTVKMGCQIDTHGVLVDPFKMALFIRLSAVAMETFVLNF